MVPWSRAEPSSHHRALGAVALAVALGVPAAGHAGGPPAALRIAVVLDDSGSMRQTDPRRLSITAAMIAVQLAGAEDRVSLVPLSGAPTPLAHGGASRALVRRLQSFARRSAQTIYDRPLRRALAVLRGSGAGQPLVLFLTDGEPDPGPGRDRAAALAAQETFLRGLTGKPPAARLYPVLLGNLGQSWRSLFDELAQRSGGRRFSVAQSGDALIDVFAGIYAAQLGSKVVVQQLSDGEHALAEIDSYVRYANLVVLSRSGPFEVSYPDRPRLADVLHSGRDPGAAQPPVYHFVEKLRPAATTLRVRLRSTSGAPGAYRALLIWDYDLVLRLAEPPAAKDGRRRLRAHLARRSAPEHAIDDEAFLRGMTVRPQICQRSDDGRRSCREGQPLTLRCAAQAQGDAPRCRFSGDFTPPAPGRYEIAAVARRQRAGRTVLEMPSLERHPLSVAGGGRLQVDSVPGRFAIDQNGEPPWRACQRLRVTLGGPRHRPPLRAQLDASALGLPPQTTLRVKGHADGSFTLRPGAQQLEVCLESRALVDRPGWSAKAPARLRVVDARWLAPQGAQAEVPIDAGITARSFWNSYKRLIIGAALLLLLLLLLIWIIRGFVSPYRFPANLRVNWGQTLERLDRNEMPLSELPQTRSGFYRNAQLWVGGGRCFIESGWPAYARFEAASGQAITVQPEEGTEVLRVSKFDPDKREPVAPGSLVSLGDAYLINDLFVRLKL